MPSPGDGEREALLRGAIDRVAAAEEALRNARDTLATSHTVAAEADVAIERARAITDSTPAGDRATASR